jgi:hypothetical protein
MGRSDSQPHLVDALAPHPDVFGWVQALVAAGQGIAKVTPALLKKAQYDEKQAKLDYIRAKKKFESAKTPSIKARAKRRMIRAREAFQLMRTQTMLSARGVVGEGPVTEFRRNILFQDWERAAEGSEERTDLEAQILKYDERLKRLKQEADMLTRSGYSGHGSSGSFSVSQFPLGKGAPFPPPRRAGPEVF